MADKQIFPGAQALLRALRQLPADVATMILEQAVVAGGDIVRKRAAELAPRGLQRRRPRTTPLADTIRLHVAMKDRAHVLVQVGTKAPYAHLLEYGHDIVARGPTRGELHSVTRVSAKGRISSRLQRLAPSDARRRKLRTALKERRAAGAIGFVKPRPFLRPAIDETREQAVLTMARVLGRGVAVSLQRRLAGAPGVQVRVA